MSLLKTLWRRSTNENRRKRAKRNESVRRAIGHAAAGVETLEGRTLLAAVAWDGGGTAPTGPIR
jgi:hypothetical protein